MFNSLARSTFISNKIKKNTWCTFFIYHFVEVKVKSIVGASSLVGSAPVYSAVVLWASQVWVPARDYCPIKWRQKCQKKKKKIISIS